MEKKRARLPDDVGAAARFASYPPPVAASVSGTPGDDGANVEIASIEIVNPPVLYEGADQVLVTSGEPYRVYDLSGWASRPFLQVTYTDGSQETLAKYETARSGEQVELSDDQTKDDPWTVGGDNQITATLGDRETTAPVTLLESPIESIEVIDETLLRPLLAETRGQWRDEFGDYAEGPGDSNWFEYFYSTGDYFNFVHRYNLSLHVTYKDGSEETSEYWALSWDGSADGYNNGRYSYSEEDIAKVNPQIETDQQNSHWTVGGENLATVRFCGCTATYSVPIVSVTSLEIVSPDHWEFIESNTGFSEYDLPYAQFRAEISDGRTVTGDRHSLSNYFANADYVSWSADQDYENPWGVGEHFVRFSFGGQTADLPVTVLENPIESIEVLEQPDFSVYFGDPFYGYIGEDDGAYHLNNVYWNSLNGLKIRVHFKDGSDKDYTYPQDYDAGTLGGYDFTAGDYDSVVTEPGSVKIESLLLGVPFTYTFNVLENPIKSLKIVGLPTITTLCPDCHPDFLGMKIEIGYTDGSTQTVTATAENTRCQFSVSYKYTIEATLNLGDKHLEIGSKIIYEPDDSSKIIYSSLEVNGYGCSDKLENCFTWMDRYIVRVVADSAARSPEWDGGVKFTVWYDDGTSQQITATPDNPDDLRITDDEYQIFWLYLRTEIGMFWVSGGERVSDHGRPISDYVSLHYSTECAPIVIHRDYYLDSDNDGVEDTLAIDGMRSYLLNPDASEPSENEDYDAEYYAFKEDLTSDGEVDICDLVKLNQLLYSGD